MERARFVYNNVSCQPCVIHGSVIWLIDEICYFYLSDLQDAHTDLQNIVGNHDDVQTTIQPYFRF